MIISPPFLSLTDIPVYDGQCVRNVMPGGIVGSGAYPISQAMGWHGGLHVHAPTNMEPVRAIADGTVVFRRDGGNARYDNEDHSTGCVVIRHATEIGAQGTTPVTVTYYSITQHLRQLDHDLPAVGRPIYRKDRLGLAGTIHGESDRIHLEIIAGDADTLKLVGRGTGELAVGGNGRTDAVYGQMYVLVPARSPCFNAQPAGASLPSAAGDSGNDDVIIGIRYEAGSATLTTYKLNGDTLGTAPQETDAEYNLYTEANARHGRLSAADQLISSPSGWYELLRFGRNLGTDPLPTNAAHWRKVVVPSQPGGAWVNLNAVNTKKFSDADFPHWARWKLIDDDATDDNSRCDSAMANAMLASPPRPGATAVLTPAQKAADRMQNLCRSDVQEKLARTICKFPTEWAKDEVRKRWAWTRETGNPHMPYPLEDETDFTEMADFAQKLCFWEELPAEDKSRLTIKHWHFHPREFIRQFRMCGWLGKRELAQLIPANIIRKPGSHNSNSTASWESPNIGAAQNFLSIHAVELNLSLRKFLINTPLRQACFFGNSTQETQWFRYLKEGNGGNSALHQGWYGRGFLQLTNPNGDINSGNNNYYKYFKFLGRVPTHPPGNQEIIWRDEIGADSHHAAHSACAYWVWNNKSAPDATNLNRPQVDNVNKYADALNNNQRKTISTGINGVKTWYYNQSFTNCATAVNFPGATGQNPPNMNGLVDRSVAFSNALMVLTENPAFETAQQGYASQPECYVQQRAV
ncbi:hypothetical protein DBV14_22025 [Variovorax sp. KBW07]|uniref:M23 family metallopeptidase n=1 Tax=Variovorax sp. KBW07 TaxID=2153358 RepID=UPI000F573EB8|nr:M23 family metallopeptidase [Variovorax sp. KBW07]RQO46620.1 hypothetical protein DBV14_22025 [Variovorax sp. KBW07]